MKYRLLVALWMALSAGLNSRPCVAQPPKTPVAIARVVEADVKSGYRVVGTVNPLRTSTIGSAIGGRVLEFYVDQGDLVKANEPLAQLRTDTLQLELAAARAELDLTRYQLDELENGARPEELAEAEAMALGAKAAMKNAQAQLRRLQDLAASRAATDADLEDARERADSMEYAFKAADAARQRIALGPRLEQIAQARARVDLQQQMVLLIEDRIRKHTIVAPFDGFVSAEYTEIGAWINSGDPVAQVIQLDEVEIQAPITADYATQLRRGMTVRVEFPELPHKLWTGTIHRIIPVADPRARTFPVTIRLTNEIVDESPLLMSGMLARVDLPAGQQIKMPLVPKDALVLNANERSVFVVETKTNGDSPPKTGIVRKVPVELGIAVDGMIQVSGNLRAGQYVIVIGNERLQPDTEVDVIDVQAEPSLGR